MPLDTRIPLMAQGIQMPDFNALALQRQEQSRNNMALQMQQAQLERAQREEEAAQNAFTRRQRIGGLVGAGDYAGAEKAAAEGGDFETLKLVQGLSADQRKQAVERNQTLAAVAMAAAELPYEQRRGFVASAGSYLAPMGFTPEQIAAFDPTDENISGIISTSQTLQQALERKDKDRRFAEDVRSNKAREGLTARGQDMSAATARRGQDISSANAAAARAVTMRGQNLSAARSSGGGGGPQGTRQQQGIASQKINGLRSIESQINRVEQAMKNMEKNGYSGFILGRVPGAVDPASNTFDKAVAGLSPLLRALTRVPGEGAMSDYESRLAQMIMPSRTDTPEGRREALATMRDLVRETKAGYEEFLGQQPAPKGGGNVIRYDAKGNRIK